MTDFNMTDTQNTLSDLTGIETDKLRIRFDINENNKIIRIIVIVDDEKTAEIIVKFINFVIDNGLCQTEDHNTKV